MARMVVHVLLSRAGVYLGSFPPFLKYAPPLEELPHGVYVLQRHPSTSPPRQPLYKHTETALHYQNLIKHQRQAAVYNGSSQITIFPQARQWTSGHRGVSFSPIPHRKGGLTSQLPRPHLSILSQDG